VDDGGRRSHANQVNAPGSRLRAEPRGIKMVWSAIPILQDAPMGWTASTTWSNRRRSALTWTPATPPGWTGSLFLLERVVDRLVHLHAKDISVEHSDAERGSRRHAGRLRLRRRRGSIGNAWWTSSAPLSAGHRHVGSNAARSNRPARSIKHLQPLVARRNAARRQGKAQTYRFNFAGERLYSPS